MLEELEVRGLGPIRHALLGLSPGMTAITGETGAGKSMLLNAIRLISGQSPETGRVRSEDDEAWVQGVFSIAAGTPVAAIASEAGASFEDDDNELFLTRIVPASGRSRAMLSGRGVPRSVLANLADRLVTIHGQSDQLRLASPARQRDFLDAAAGDKPEHDAYDIAWQALCTLDQRLERLQSQEASSRQRMDYLRASIERIDGVGPQPDEDTELKERRSRIEHATQITQGVETALGALDASQLDIDIDAEGASATDLITKASQSLRDIHVDGEFAQLAKRLESLNADLADVVFSLSHELDDEPKVEDLDEINGRIHALAELTRNWGPTLRDVMQWRDRAVLEVEDLDASPEKVTELVRERGRLLRDAVLAATVLSKARARAAVRLSQQVDHELSALAMRGARLDITVRRREDTATLDAHGLDDIAFAFTPFPGSPRLPMGKSASGGELSRLMLALELSATSRDGDKARIGDESERRGDAGARDESVNDPGMTFIFDEVDAGVGGRAAVELGHRLARLARHAQVIVVTHLAQVASWADTQFVVSKGQDAGVDADADRVVTAVHEVRGDERVREIARMLSGSESDASLMHARELIGDSTLTADAGKGPARV